MRVSQYINITAVFLLCQQFFVESAVEKCSADAEYSISGMMLRRHIFKKITGAPLGSVCLRECYRDVKCQSFNYVISQSTCELSNRTKEARPEDFGPSSDRYYFKRVMNRGKFVWPKHLKIHQFTVIIYNTFAWLCANIVDPLVLNSVQVLLQLSRRKALLRNCSNKWRLSTVHCTVCDRRLMLIIKPAFQ